jgi:hypothetical protein
MAQNQPLLNDFLLKNSRSFRFFFEIQGHPARWPLGTKSALSVFMDTIYAILAVDDTTSILVAGITVACALILFQMTESLFMSLIFAPMAAFAALLGIWLSNQFGIYYSGDQDSNTVLGALVGLAFSAIFIVAATRITFAIINFITPKPVNDRRAEQPKPLQEH